MMLKTAKKKGWKWIISLFLPLVLSCATQTQVDTLNTRIDRLEARLYSLRKEIRNELKKTNKNVKSLRNNTADISADLDSIREEISEIRGKTEENRAIIKRIVESDLEKIDQREQQLNQISQTISKLEGQLKQIQDYLGLTEQEKIASTKKEDLYSSAYSLYKDGRYEEAILKFKDFLKKYPNSNLSDNAWFWIGESYMGLKRYEKAILAYHEVIKKHPKGNKVPASMLRQAQAFLKIKDKTSAKVILKRLIRKFPRSSEAKIARKLLRKIR